MGRSKEVTIRERFNSIKAKLAEEGSTDQPEKSHLYSKLNPMLFVSDLVYAFAFLRNLAKTEELEGDDLIIPAELNKPGNTPEARNKIYSEAIDEMITVQNVAKFITLNLDRLNATGKINSDLFIIGLLSLSKIEKAHLVHFDGDYAGKTFVYGLMVNHDQKRITAVFRGSSNTGDWKANLQFLKGQLITPEDLIKLGFDETKKIKIHGGFKDYILHKSGPCEQQKYNQMKKAVLDLYMSGECNGYELFITGHSLGGAVSTIVAFLLASSQEIAPFLKGKPVVNISFASPYVGGAAWAEAFELLERAGRIQHIRVSNRKDLVPTLPPTPNYRHVGVGIYLNPRAKEKYELSYGDKRSVFGHWSFTPVTHHSMEAYYDRCKDIGPHIADATIKGLYKTYANINIEG